MGSSAGIGSDYILVLRADCSPMIGLGHVFRISNLALASSDKIPIHFLTVSHENSSMTIQQIFRRTNQEKRLFLCPSDLYDVPMTHNHTRDTRTWIPSEERDAKITIEYISGLRKQYVGSTIILILDHYGLNIGWEKKLYPEVDRLIVLDDLGRDHWCNFAIQPNWESDQLLSKGKMISGHHHAIIAPRIRVLVPKVRTKVNSILLNLGGYADLSFIIDIIKTILSQISHSTSLIVVLGHSYEKLTKLSDNHELRGQFKKAENKHGNRLKIRGFVDFADIYPEVDLCIGAVGTSLYERASLGIPTLGYSVAKNQVELTNYLDQMGLIKTWRNLQELKELLTKYIDEGDSTSLQQWSEYCINCVDSKGIDKLLKYILPGHSPTGTEWISNLPHDLT